MEQTRLRGKAYLQWLAEKAKRREEIRRAYKEAQSLSIVADQYGLTRGRICQIVNSKT